MSAEGRTIRVVLSRPESRQAIGSPVAQRINTPEECRTPPIDIHDGPDALILVADLPGATEESVSVELADNVLSLSAGAPAPVSLEARMLHQEVRFAPFFRAFILSDEVDRERISAELKDGVLRLTLPKADRLKTRRIEVRTS